MSKSIMQDYKACYITGATYNLHKHHVFGGSRRSASDKWGCWVWLREDYHNLSNKGIHFDRVLDITIKQDTQEVFERLYSHKKFMEVFGRSYL